VDAREKVFFLNSGDDVILQSPFLSITEWLRRRISSAVMSCQVLSVATEAPDSLVESLDWTMENNALGGHPIRLFTAEKTEANRKEIISMHAEWRELLKPDCLVYSGLPGFDIFRFVATIAVKKHEGPLSLPAQVWRDCLGNVAIPFDRGARQQLIDDAAMKGPLRPHIELWQKRLRRSPEKYAW